MKTTFAGFNKSFNCVMLYIHLTKVFYQSLLVIYLWRHSITGLCH